MGRKKQKSPATERERQDAALSAACIRRSLVDRDSAGERTAAHLKMCKPRGSVWIVMWAGLPGLQMDATRKVYSHALLPGWEYTVQEMKTELIEDLERLAETGERPTAETFKLS